MPPRPAPPCSRALRRQVTSSPDSIWISNHCLANAFDWYCVVSHVARRRTGNVPGPLEARRRLGKRQIGGLNALQNPAGLPDWSLPALDLSDWSWQPPSSLSLRREKAEEAGQPCEWTQAPVLRWLAQWLWASPNTGLHSSKPVEVLDGFQSMVHTRPLHELVLACEAVCTRLGDDADLMAGVREDKDGVLDAVGNVWAALEARFGGTSDDALRVFAQLYSSLLTSGLTVPTPPAHNLGGLLAQLYSSFTSGLAPSGHALGSHISCRLLAQLAKLPASDELCELLVPVMRAVAPSFFDIRPFLLAILDNFFLSWSHGLWSDKQIRLLSKALSVLNHRTAKVLGADAAELLLQQTGPPEGLGHARYAWLSVVVRMPTFRYTFLQTGLKKFFKEPAMAKMITSRDICVLVLAQCTASEEARLHHPHRVRNLFSKISARDDSIGLGALVFALWKWDKNWDRHLLHLFSCLKKVGLVGDAPASLEGLARALVAQQQHAYPRLVRKVTALCGDFEVALQLHHEVYVNLPQRSRWKDEWDSATWEGYLMSAASDKSTRPGAICCLLGLVEYNTQTAAIAAGLAQSFAQDDRLPDRYALYLVMQCKRFLERRRRKLPGQLLDAMYTVVTRDLKKGQMGRGTRLKWLVETMHQQRGPEMAEQVANMLNAWRSSVKQVQVREKEKAEMAKREKEFKVLQADEFARLLRGGSSVEKGQVRQRQQQSEKVVTGQEVKILPAEDFTQLPRDESSVEKGQVHEQKKPKKAVRGQEVKILQAEDFTRLLREESTVEKVQVRERQQPKIQVPPPPVAEFARLLRAEQGWDEASRRRRTKLKAAMK